MMTFLALLVTVILVTVIYGIGFFVGYGEARDDYHNSKGVKE
jgi:hypothetical protein